MTALDQILPTIAGFGLTVGALLMSERSERSGVGSALFIVGLLALVAAILRALELSP